MNPEQLFSQAIERLNHILDVGLELMIVEEDPERVTEILVNAIPAQLALLEQCLDDYFEEAHSTEQELEDYRAYFRTTYESELALAEAIMRAA